MKRSLLAVPAGLSGLAYLAPRLFKRSFAPPQHPATVTPADLGLPQAKVRLRSKNDTELLGWFVSVQGQASAVVVLHGWGSNSSAMLPLAEHLNSAGFHSFFVDARNHGRSEHDDFASMPRFAEDLDVAIDWLEARADVVGVGVIGHSVGGAASILAASRDARIRAVVSVSAFAHPRDMMERQLSRLPGPVVAMILAAVQRTIGYRFEEFAPTERIKLLQIPILVVHGDNDRLVPLSNLHELAEAHPEAETLIIPGGGHSDLGPYLPHVDAIVGFLGRSFDRFDGSMVSSERAAGSD